MKQTNKTHKIQTTEVWLDTHNIKTSNMKQASKTNKIHTLNQTIDCDMTD